MDLQDDHKDMRHVFSCSQDTKTALSKHNRMQLNPQDISLDNAGNDAVLRSPDTLRNILCDVLQEMAIHLYGTGIGVWSDQTEFKTEIQKARTDHTGQYRES